MDIPKLTVMAYLNPQWQQWLAENLVRNVNPATIADVFKQQGMKAAHKAFMDDFNLHKPEVPLPAIDFSRNLLTLTDATPKLLFVCDKPVVAIMDHFLSAQECEALIAVADSKLEEATVVDPATGNHVQHQHRTSRNAAFARGENDLIRTIEARIAQTIAWPVENGEGLQVLRYDLGGEYKAHYDYFDTKSAGGLKHLENGGQRVGTFLIYLSDVEGGGGTRFPSMHFEVRPKAGMALYFANMLTDGSVDPKSLHAGVPVTEGVKYLASKWLRERQYGK